MKGQYYLAPNLDVTEHVTKDLQALGIDSWFIHVLSRDEAGLKKQEIRSGNYIEKSDALAGALTGGVAGLVIGALAALVISVSPLASGFSAFLYALVVLAPAVFGLWEGALLRSKYASRKIALFREDIEAGRYLFIFYVPSGKGEAVREMIRNRYPAVEHVAVDENFMNPFERPRRA